VYVALDEFENRKVALKIEPSKMVSGEMEAHVLKLFQFNHHCPQLYAIGTTDKFV